MNEIVDVRLFKPDDILLVPLCLIVLYIFALLYRRKYQQTEIAKYFLPALTLRFVFVFVYALIVQFYYGYGDTIMFYRSLQDMHRAAGDDFGNLLKIFLANRLDPADQLVYYFSYDGGYYTHYYMFNPSNYTVPKFALPFSLIFFKSYLCISLCICFFSFAGCWRIFKMMYELYPQLKYKFAVSILFLSSILFWGGSFLKDSICLGSLGFLLYALYSIFIKKRKVFVSVLIIAVTAYLLFYIKVYMLISIISAFVLWWFLHINKQIRNTAIRRISIVFLGAAAIGLISFAVVRITATEMGAQYSSDKILQTVQSLQTNYADAEGSSFEIGQVDNSFLGSLLLLPSGMVATLFRPFPWEISNPLMALSSLEAFGFIVLTIMAFRQIGFKQFFTIAFADPVVVFCMVYSLIFAALVGVSTNNFGALVRYKIPCLPFYLFMIFIIMDKSGKFSPDTIFHRKFF